MNALNKVKKYGHKACINCVDGATVERNLLATGSEDQSVRLWDIRTDRAVKCIAKCFEESVEAVRFSVSDENVLYAASGKCLFSFDLRTDGVLITSPSIRSDSCSTDIISAVAINPSGSLLAVADDAGIVTIVDSKKLNAYKPKRLRGHSNLVNAIAFSPIDATSFVSGGFDYQLYSWDLGKPGDSPASVVDIARLGNEGLDEFSSKSVNPPFVQSLSFTCDGQAIAVALGDGSLKVVSAEDPSCLWATASDAHAGMATALYCSSSNILYSGGIDRTVKCWRLEDRRKADVSDESAPIETDTVDVEPTDNCATEDISKSDSHNRDKKKKKNRKKNKRFGGNNFPMQFSLLWDEDNLEKVNVISGFKVSDTGLKSDKIFIGDNSSNLTIYTVEGGY